MYATCRISGFQLILPSHVLNQEKALEWQVLRTLPLVPDEKKDLFLKSFRRYSVSPTKISQRYTELPDFSEAEEGLHPLHGKTASLNKRMEIYRRCALQAFERFYHETVEAPDHIIHVSCTGYVSPSAGQILISKNSWLTKITQAYHMGCYASFPAIRMAQAFARESVGKRIDVVHTELCSLHMNTSSTLPEQVLISSLFGDGYIKYSLSCSEKDKSESKGLSVLALKEVLLKDSETMMTWVPGESGFEMTLSREVPLLIRDNIRSFVEELCKEAGVSLAELIKHGHFAIHPGGPKIIELVQEQLELSEEQVACSKRVLFERGNMSSATLPHVWAKMLEQDLQKGTLVMSVAFGPGLTVFGGIFRI
jgi:predicted naringenin-chalcone synthase